MEEKKEDELNKKTDDKNNIKIKNLLECQQLEENFQREKEFGTIYKKIQYELAQEFEIPLNINNNKVQTKNFIFTDNAIKKLKEIKYYILNHYPVLLEGPTGTAKTKSVEILCEEMGLTLKRFNLSSETKTADLFGRYAGDPNSFSGISFQKGVFIEAFENGYTLLLDEINLASNQVLQSFEECLDSQKISCEIPGMPWKEIKMGKGFNLIATQNPNKGLFANKRQDLGKKFLSRFHIINFDSFQKKELYQIAFGLGTNKSISKNILKELVDFHEEWSNLEERSNDILCFTIREIEATINAIANKENIRDAILSIYGSRYKSKEFEKLKSILSKYKYLNVINTKPKKFFKNDFLYMTPALENVLKAVKLSFDNYRHIMIIGDEGTGKSQISKYIAEYMDNQNKDKVEIDDDGIYYCECTEDLKCSDLIGNQYPTLNSSKEASQQLMKWEDGFLTLAITKGKCCILDNIEEAPATITERLNGLLDKKLDIQKDRIFEIPECPERKEVKINKNFRLLCICNYGSISKMSPAFLNRFDIITLEDQLKPYYNIKNSENHFLEIIDTLIKQHKYNYKSNINQIKNKEEKVKKKEKHKKFNKFLGLGDDEDLEENTKEKKLDFIYTKDENLNKLIYEKILENINKGDLSIYKLSLFCRAIIIFIEELPHNEKISLKKIVNYAFQLTISQNIEDDPEIEDFIYNEYLKDKPKDSKDDTYFFQDSPKLKSFMAKLLAASIINLHICVVGKTGVGKTSCAREFSRIRAQRMKLPKDFYMHSFHSNTKSSHFYGNITMKNKEIEFINGTLLNAMEQGTTFIADEMNLSPEIVMKSLVPALDLNLNCKLYIPGIKKKIQIHQKFFFIACQNDFTTTGRNSLPKLLAKKLKCIPYPEPPLEDIQKICSDINLELYDKCDNEKKKEIIKNGEQIAKYMHELNKLQLTYIPSWSIRDITKVLKRVEFQSLEKNNYKYDNINFIDNIVFYTLSGIYKKDLKDKNINENLIKNLLNILKRIFSLGNSDIQDIKDIINEKADIIKDKEKGDNFLRKGKCGISLKYIQFYNTAQKLFSLPSLYNELFQILLAHDEEPILIIGESGYKTYLAQLLLPRITPIQLNNETTIGQLLGSTVFLSDKEEKLFYYNQIYNILDMPTIDTEMKMVQEWVDINNNNHLEKSKEQDTLMKKINDEIFKKKSKIEKLKPILEILKKKLLKRNENKSTLNNINLVFKPGLILDSILKGKSLILKYLSNLPTVVLERFNELFSGKHNLTLNEDIHDTFTEGNKEISDLGENFRIFATCSLGEQNKLSEAVLSRFTVICTDKYELEEQKDVLKSFLANNELEFDQNCIDEVIQFSKNQRNYSLSQMINALSLSNQKEIFKSSESMSRVNILSFILFRITYGLSYKYYKNPDSPLFEIEEKLKSDLPRFKGEIIKGDDDGPLIKKKKDGIDVIESKYNKLQIKRVKGVEIKNDSLNTLTFTKTFSEMVDYIHLGIATNTPVILEGGTGLGKQTAINYVAHKINFKIINFIITQSTKIEDLLGRNQILSENGNINVKFCETKILKALNGEYEGKEGENIIIVFHNLNKASSALMESLCSIFDKKQKYILRPDGLSVAKSKVNLIGIVNSQSNIALKEKLPLSLINCVFYYILPKLMPKEIEQIIKKKFTAYKLESEAPDFVDCFNKSRQFSNTKGNISYFSLNDITKYILFRRHTKNSIDQSIILQIIFAYRFIQSEFIKDIMNELGFLSMKVNPIIKNKDKYLSISFKNKDAKDEIKLPYIHKFEIDKKIVEQKINTLNLKQKQCMLFLVLSVLCKRACIVQGDTASGKTYLVRLFAEMIGQKLIVYQINKETGLSMFTGQSTLQDHLEQDEINTILNYFKTLSKNEELKSYLNNYFFYDDYDEVIIKKKWTVKNFHDLIKKIRDYYEKDTANLQNEEYKEFEDITNNLEDLIQPHKRFKKKESTFIKALKNGDWVLIDGIESANPVISDKLIRLCDENSELDLTETGENIIFSKNSSDINKIHDNFHLFINYNPLNKSNNNQLNEMFLNKCITFTLEPMDVDVESSAQIVYGFMKNTDKINEILCQEISSKVALIHQAMNKKILQNQEFFSGGIEFTGRIIKYISEEISKSQNNDDLCKHLVNALYLNYINSINNKNDIKNVFEVKDIINSIIKKETVRFDTGEKDIYLKYSEIFKVLRNIQKVSKKILPGYDFNFLDFLNSLKRVEISDLNLILYHIDETLNLLDEFVGNSINKKIKYFHYYNLQIIKKLLKNLLNYVDKNNKYNLMDFTLNDKDEFFNKSILIEEISKINLVERLETEISKIKLTDCFICLPNEFIDYLDSTKKLLETNDIKELYNNLKIVENCLNQGINITQLFPFNLLLLDEIQKKDNSGKIIRMYKVIFLIYKIIENKVNLQFDYDNNIIIFDNKNDDDAPFKNLYIKISLTKDFYFINTNIINKIVLEEAKILVITDSFENEEEKIDVANWFYIICNKILDNKIQINDKKQMRDILEDISDNNIRIIDELNEEFRIEIKEEKRTYSITKLLSKPNENLNIKEEILIMKIWYLILFYDEETLSLITPFFSLPFEKDLLDGVKNMYEHINPKLLNKYISFTKNLLEELKIANSSLFYGSPKTFLYKIQAGFFHYSYIEDKDKKDYYTQINQEMNYYKKLKLDSSLEEYWSISKSINCLRNQYSNLKDYVENSNLTEKYRNNLNDLISKIKASNFEGKERNKDKLIQLLENKLDNPTKEIYEKCKENVEKCLNNLKENVTENQILFPPIKSKNEYAMNKDHKYVICLDLLKNYSIYHKKLTHIFQSSKNISDIFGLDKEIEIIIDILGQYAIENGDYIRIYEEKVMGIIRAEIIYNIIKIGKSKEKIEELFNIFITLSKLINDHTGGTGIKYFNENILTWTKSDKTNLEDYFLIPKFEPKDFLYLFLITYTEEKENKKLSKPGFLFKNPRNKNLNSILSNSLEELGEGEKIQFENYVGKIGRSLLKNIFHDKWDHEFKDLSNNELLDKLNQEEKNLKSKIEELKRNDKPFEEEEMHKDIIMAIINCFNLAIFYEHNYSSENKLTYEDIDFFKSKNWKNELISKYPGMSYWLSKNHSFYLELMSKKDLIDCFIHEDNKISFWYFQIRVFSNIKTFEYDCYDQKNIEIKNRSYNVGKELNYDDGINIPKKEVEKFVKNNIFSLIRDKKPVNIKWINLVLNDIPPDIKITDKNLRHFYEFFASLIADSINDAQKETKNMIIIEYIIKLLDLIFKNTVEEIFNKNINNKENEIILLINKPQDEIIKKFKEKNQKKKKGNRY